MRGFCSEINVELISKTVSVEKRSEHPLAKAIVQYAEDNGFVISEVEDFQMIPGKGVAATLSGKTVICGNALYIKQNSIAETGKMQNILANLRNQGKASIIVAENGKAIGIIALSDTIRPTAKNVVAKLAATDTDVVLLTGVNHLTAKYMAEQVGIKNIRAELLPAQKVSSIEDLQKENKNVCMIGDGVNDAPALKWRMSVLQWAVWEAILP